MLTKTQRKASPIQQVRNDNHILRNRVAELERQVADLREKHLQTLSHLGRVASRLDFYGYSPSQTNDTSGA